MPVSSFAKNATKNEYKRIASTAVSWNADLSRLMLWRSLSGCTKIQECPFNRTHGFLCLSLLQCAEICSMSLSHTALSALQLYHHILLSRWMYQVTVKMHRACKRKVVLHQRVLVNSSFLSNKLIASISDSCRSTALLCYWWHTGAWEAQTPVLQ